MPPAASGSSCSTRTPPPACSRGRATCRSGTGSSASGRTARVHSVHDDRGRLVGVIPEGHEREGSPTGPVEVRRFLGGTDVTDYLGPVARPEDRADVAEAYIAALAADRDWDDAVLGGLPVDSGWGDLFARSAKDHGLDRSSSATSRRSVRGSTFAAATTPTSRGLKGKLRQELTRKARKLARDAGELAVVEVPAGRGPRADGGLPRARPRFGAGEGRVLRQGGAARLVPRAGRGVRPGPHPAAAPAGRRRDAGRDDGVARPPRRVGGLQLGVRRGPRRARRPAWSSSASSSSCAAREGCVVLDLLRGDESYKYQFGAEDRAVERLVLVRSR